MLADYLRRGIIAGFAAGLGYGLYVTFVGNPLTEYLHDAGHDHGHGHDHGTAVSETTNALVSAGSGVLWAILLGGLFAVAFYVFEPALPGSTRVKSYVLAGAGFLSVSATPWLVLTPAAPGAEQAYPVETRLAIYGALVVLGVVVSAVAIVAFTRAPSRRLGLVAGAIPILAVAVVLPTATPTVVTHPTLADELVAVYRALVAFSQAGIWLAIAASFDWLRRYEGRLERTPVSDDPLASP